MLEKNLTKLKTCIKEEDLIKEKKVKRFCWVFVHLRLTPWRSFDGLEKFLREHFTALQHWQSIPCSCWAIGKWPMLQMEWSMLREKTVFATKKNPHLQFACIAVMILRRWDDIQSSFRLRRLRRAARAFGFQSRSTSWWAAKGKECVWFWKERRTRAERFCYAQNGSNEKWTVTPSGAF